MQKQFKKSNLKNYMVVETKDHNLYLYLGDNPYTKDARFVSKNPGRTLPLYNYAEDLTFESIEESEDTITRIYEVKTDKFEFDFFNKENLKLIWKRYKTRIDMDIEYIDILTDDKIIRECTIDNFQQENMLITGNGYFIYIDDRYEFALPYTCILKMIKREIDIIE